MFLLAISWLRVRFTAQVRGLRGSFRVEVSAVYGLVRLELGTGDRSGRVRPREAGPGTTGRSQAWGWSRGRAWPLTWSRGTVRARAWARAWAEVSGRLPASIPAMVRAARSLLSKTTCTRLVMNARIGTGEASSTGISTGLAWEAVGVAVAFARESVGRWRCSPTVNISPSFVESRVDLDLDCVLAIRLGHAVIAVLGVAGRALRTRPS